MAWQCGGTSNAELVENMCRAGLITDPRVKQAFLAVDRAHYCPRLPYDDSPQQIGYRATISAPHMHAAAVEQLVPYLIPTEANPAPRVLDVGSGSGYLTHIMAELVTGSPPPPPDAPASSSRPVVIGVEHIDQLCALSEANTAKSASGRALLQSETIRYRVGDGRQGWVEPGVEAGYAAIHVGAAAREVYSHLLDQLRAPGRMFIPVEDDGGHGIQYVWAIDKGKDGVVTRRKLFGVKYVPLTDRKYYLEGEDGSVSSTFP